VKTSGTGAGPGGHPGRSSFDDLNGLRGDGVPLMPSLQHKVQSVLDQLVDTGAETGLQVAVYHHGALVVDAVAGVADSRTGRLVTPETPFFSFSAGKVMTSLIAHLLVKTGAVGYDTPVVDLWPEFGTHGKATATLRHVLTHSVGVPAIPRGIGPADLTDWSRVCAAIADAEPRWRPGTETGYHSFTFGFLVGEVARRATGRSMRQLLPEWVTVPLGIDGDLYFGVPRTDLARLARLEDAGPRPVAPPDGDAILAPWELQPTAAMGNNHEILQADIQDPSHTPLQHRTTTRRPDHGRDRPTCLSSNTEKTHQGTDQAGVTARSPSSALGGSGRSRTGLLNTRLVVTWPNVRSFPVRCSRSGIDAAITFSRKQSSPVT